MAGDLGLIVAAGAVVAFTVALGALVLRVPRCPGCGRPGVAEARTIADAHPSLVEVVYWCRACHVRVGRRTIGNPGE